MTEVKTGNRW